MKYSDSLFKKEIHNFNSLFNQRVFDFFSEEIDKLDSSEPAPEGSVAAPANPPTTQSQLPTPLDSVAKSNYLNTIRKLLSYCQDNFSKLENPSVSALTDKIIKTNKIDASNADAIDKQIDQLMDLLNGSHFPEPSLD